MADFTCYKSGEAFLEAFRPGLFNAVFMDIMLAKNGLNGLETAEKLRAVAARISLRHQASVSASTGFKR